MRPSMRVFAVCLPGDVEEIANHRHRADQKVDADIAEHRRERELRGAALPGVVDDRKRNDASHGVRPETALLFSVCYGLVYAIGSLPGALAWLVYSPPRAVKRRE